MMDQANTIIVVAAVYGALVFVMAFAAKTHLETLRTERNLRRFLGQWTSEDGANQVSISCNRFTVGDKWQPVRGFKMTAPGIARLFIENGEVLKMRLDEFGKMNMESPSVDLVLRRVNSHA